MAKILVVDDSPRLRALAAKVLQFAGHETQTAASGEQALQVIERKPLDLVVLDLSMPEMDGFAVLERLSRMGLGRPPLPVVIFSAHDDNQTRMRAEQLGASGFVSKGAEGAEVLRAEVSVHLDNAAGRLE